MIQRVLFLYGNDPNPSLIERAQMLENTGDFESHIAYWHREKSDISIPFSTKLSDGRVHQISLPDPRGNPINRILLSLKFVLRLRRVIKRVRPAVIYAVNPDMLGLAAIALLGMKNIGVVYDFQDQKGTNLNTLAKSIYRTILRRASYVVIRSEGFKFQIEKESLVNTSTPVEYIAEAPLDWKDVREPHKDRPHLVVGYFGNIRGRDQLWHLLSATKELRASGRDIKLRFAGGGPEAAWLQKQVDSLDYVTFTGAFDYFSEYKTLFATADIVHAVYPLDWANYLTHEARRFHEAAAMGVPLIVSSGTFMAERVRHLGIGWDVDPESAEGLLEVLRDVYDNRAMLSEAIATPELRKEHQLETYEELLVDATTRSIRKSD